MKRINPLIPAAAVLAVLLAAGLLLRETLLRYVLQPLASFLWLVWRVLASVDHQVYWYALIAGLLVLILRRVPARAADYRRAHNGSPEKPTRGLAHWEALMRGAETDSRQTENLRVELRDLAASALAVTKHIDTNEALTELTAGRVELPEEVRYFLFPEDGEQSSSVTFYRRFLRRGGLTPSTTRPGTQTTLAWLADTLENAHEE